MTQQDFRHGPLRLEIAPPICYPRAVTPGGEDPAPGEPARAIFPQAQDAAPSPEPSSMGPSGTPVWMPAPTPQEQAWPLRARGADMRRRSHRRHADAATPREELAALTDYVRSALGTAERTGMRHPASAAAVRAAIGALLEAGDTLTAAMHTWRPES